jgi:hypothetical protein
MHCDRKHPCAPKMFAIFIKSYIIHISFQHISVINRHPQADVIQRNIKPAHLVNICNVTNKELRITRVNHKHKNVNTVDSVMLKFS